VEAEASFYRWERQSRQLEPLNSVGIYIHDPVNGAGAGFGIGATGAGGWATGARAGAAAVRAAVS
jgi:hypothetical protein